MTLHQQIAPPTNCAVHANVGASSKMGNNQQATTKTTYIPAAKIERCTAHSQLCQRLVLRLAVYHVDLPLLISDAELASPVPA